MKLNPKPTHQSIDCMKPASACSKRENAGLNGVPTYDCHIHWEVYLWLRHPLVQRSYDGLFLRTNDGINRARVSINRRQQAAAPREHCWGAPTPPCAPSGDRSTPSVFSSRFSVAKGGFRPAQFFRYTCHDPSANVVIGTCSMHVHASVSFAANLFTRVANPGYPAALRCDGTRPAALRCDATRYKCECWKKKRKGERNLRHTPRRSHFPISDASSPSAACRVNCCRRPLPDVFGNQCQREIHVMSARPDVMF